MSEIKQVAQLYGFSKEPNPQAGRVYDADGISPTLDTCSGGNRMPKIAEPFIVASRGRNPDNPNDRKKGGPMVQRLEPNTQGTTNTLTTVQKDNLVAEPIILDDTYRVREPRQFEGVSSTIRAHRNGFKVVEPIVYDDYNGRVREDQDTVGTITPSAANLAPKNSYKIIEAEAEASDGEPTDSEKGWVTINGRKCRIRQLTEKECLRLMGFEDEDYYKMAAVNSKTQIYKQAGNSIVVPVLCAIFRQLFEEETE